MKSVLFSKKLMNGNLIDLRTCDENATLHHHEFFELAYVLSGSAEHTIDGHSMIISKGDYFFMNLKASHGYTAIGQGFQMVNCLFMPEFLDKSLNGAHSFSEIMNNYPSKFERTEFSDRVAGRVFHDGDGFISLLLSKMLEEFEENKKGRLDVIKSLLLTLLISIAREDEETYEKTSYVGSIKSYIFENFTGEPSLSEISSELGISLTYASLIFKRATGSTFRDYLMRLRIEKACDLLRTSGKTINEIAELVGYSDPAFFYKSFKKHLAISPATYRKLRKLKQDD